MTESGWCFGRDRGSLRPQVTPQEDTLQKATAEPGKASCLHAELTRTSCVYLLPSHRCAGPCSPAPLEERAAAQTYGAQHLWARRTDTDQRTGWQPVFL